MPRSFTIERENLPEVVQGWLDSELHCPNVRNGDFVAIGVGYAFNPQSKYKSYWTMSLGGL